MMKYTVKDAAIRLGMSKSWLDKKRVQGGGPIFHKFGRRVLYDLQDLDSWAIARRQNNTSGS